MFLSASNLLVLEQRLGALKQAVLTSHTFEEPGMVQMAFSPHAQAIFNEKESEQLRTFVSGYKIMTDISDSDVALELLKAAVRRFAIGSMGSAFSDYFEFRGVSMKVAASFGRNPVTSQPCELYLDVCATKDF